MQHRIKKLRQRMEAKAIEAILIGHPLNRRYMSGFTGTSGMVLITQQEAIIVTDFRYLRQVKNEAPDFQIVEHIGNQILPKVAELCHKLGLKSLCFEAEYLTVSEFQELEGALSSVQLVPEVGLVEELRLVKDAEELAVIKEAVAIADQAYLRILEELRPGVTEKEIALKLEVFLREMGAESSSFTTIVASGKRSSFPHGVASDKPLVKGDLITMDFGALYKGYVSDITRNAILGTPTSAQREIYQIVSEALHRVKAEIRGGMTAAQADSIARDFITEAGYGDYFGHGTGHGIGLDIHEAPRLGPTSDERLLNGMVVTVEPGIYVPEIGGIRIEDDVYLAETGIEVLTKSTRELIQID